MISPSPYALFSPQNVKPFEKHLQNTQTHTLNWLLDRKDICV